MDDLLVRPKTPWTYENSIFKEYRADTEEFDRECFESDWVTMKRPKISNEQEFAQIRIELFKNYKTIKQMFKYFGQFMGNTFAINLSTFTDIIRDELNLIDGEVIRLSDIDLMFSLVKSNNKGVFNPPNGLVRYQLAEIYLRLAFKKYNPFGLQKTMSDGIRMFNEKNMDQLRTKFH